MSADLSFRIAATLATVVIALVVRWLVVRWLNRTVSDGDVLFRARKAITYIAMAVAVFLLTWIWLPFFDDLGTFLGLLVAGLAIALADVFLDLAGWLFIMLRRPFRVGDRIEIDGTAGDVVDVRAFRFTLLEIKSWVDADQSTGRLVHVPNGHLFRHPTANYTEGFFHIWHEMPVLITCESDWRRAEELIHAALEPLVIAEEGVQRGTTSSSSVNWGQRSTSRPATAVCCSRPGCSWRHDRGAALRTNSGGLFSRHLKRSPRSNSPTPRCERTFMIR
jgi:small-conductance mechanosensitive channel